MGIKVGVKKEIEQLKADQCRWRKGRDDFATACTQLTAQNMAVEEYEGVDRG